MSNDETYTMQRQDYSVAVADSFDDCWDYVNNNTETPCFDSDFEQRVTKSKLRHSLKDGAPVLLYNEGDPRWSLRVERHELEVGGD